jgi:hypothetical protein
MYKGFGSDLAIYGKSTATTLQNNYAFLDMENTCPRTGF